MPTDFERGAAAERARFTAILALPAAKRNPKAAMALALDPGVTLTAATIALGDLSAGGSGGLSAGWGDIVAKMNADLGLAPSGAPGDAKARAGAGKGWAGVVEDLNGDFAHDR